MTLVLEESPATVATLAPAGASLPQRSEPAARQRLLAPVYFAGRSLEAFFGVATLIVGLALLATYPLLQFLSLGYLLEVSGRVARTGRLRDGFIGLRRAARVGGLAIGLTVLALPLMFIGSMTESARLIDADSPAAERWQLALVICT